MYSLRGVKPDSPKVSIGSGPKFFEFKALTNFRSLM
jgi:hypothetical protein